MADDVTSGSKALYAYEALKLIATAENVSLHSTPGSREGKRPATRAWILNTLSDCVNAMNGTPPIGARVTAAEEWLSRPR